MRARRFGAVLGFSLVLSLAPLAFADGPYPPPGDAGGVITPSRIEAGGCANFSGDGFNGGVKITVKDDSDAAGSSTTRSDGTFTKRMCYSSTARVGKHVITGTGDAPDSPATASPSALSFLRTSAAAAATRRTVTAILYVTGIEQTAPQPISGGGTSAVSGPGSGSTGFDGRGLPFSGLPAIAIAVVGTGLVAVGSAALLMAERRHRRRRRRSVAA